MAALPSLHAPSYVSWDNLPHLRDEWLDLSQEAPELCRVPAVYFKDAWWDKATMGTNASVGARMRTIYRNLWEQGSWHPECMAVSILKDYLFKEDDLYRYEYVAARALVPDGQYVRAAPHVFPDCDIWYSRVVPGKDESTPILVVAFRPVALREDCGYVGWWDDDESGALDLGAL